MLGAILEIRLDRAPREALRHQQGTRGVARLPLKPVHHPFGRKQALPVTAVRTAGSAVLVVQPGVEHDVDIMPISGLCRIFLRSPSESANTRTKCRHNSVVHFLASNVRRAMETCPIALAGCAGAGVAEV